MPIKIDLNELLKTVQEAEAQAAKLVADPEHGASQFVAPIRGSLAHAVDLLTHHQAWLANSQNPKPASEAPVASSKG